MARIQTPGIAPEKYRPVATPETLTARTQRVDTFVNPATTVDRNAGQQTAQLAQALSRFSPSLARFAAQRQDNANIKATEAGKQKALELFNAGKSYKQAIDEGVIQPHDSPFFVAGVQEQYGAVMADARHNAVIAKLAENRDLAESVDPKEYAAAYQQAAQEWDQTNIGKADGSFQKGFGARAAGHMLQAEGDFSDAIGRKLQQRSIAAHFAYVKESVRKDVARVPVEELAKALTQRNAQLVATGRSERQVTSTTVRAIREVSAELAREGKGEQAVKLLDLVKQGDGSAIGDSDVDREEVRQAHEDVVRIRDYTAEKANQDHERAQKELAENTYGDALTALLGNPNLSPSKLQDYAKKVATIPGAAERIMGLRSAVQESAEDPRTVQRMWRQIWLGGGVSNAEIAQAVGGGSISLQKAHWLMSEQQAKTMRERQDERDVQRLGMEQRQFAAQARQAYKDVVSDPVFTRIAGTIPGQFNSSGGILSGPASEAAADAQASFQRDWIMWRMGEGASATPDQATTWLANHSKQLVHLHRQGLIGFDANGASILAPKGSKTAPAESTSPTPKQKNRLPDILPDEMAQARSIISGRSRVIPPALLRKATAAGKAGSNEDFLQWLQEQAELYDSNGVRK